MAPIDPIWSTGLDKGSNHSDSLLIDDFKLGRQVCDAISVRVRLCDGRIVKLQIVRQFKVDPGAAEDRVLGSNEEF